MRKIYFLFMIALSIFSLTLISCGKDENEDKPSEKQTENTEDEDNFNLEDISFNSKDVAFSGFPYSITCENIPDGLSVEYEGNDVSEVGNHKVYAYIKNAEGEVIHTLEAYINIILPQYTSQTCGICEGKGIYSQPVVTPELSTHTPTTFKASSVSFTTKEIATGVLVHTYTFQLNNGNKSQVIVTEVDLNYAGIAAGSKNNVPEFDYEIDRNKDVPYEMALAYEKDNPNRTVVAVTNADFFGTLSVNAFAKDGVIVKTGHNDTGGYDYTVLANDIPASKPMLFGVSGNVAQIKPIIQNGTIKETIQSKLSYALTITHNGKPTKLADDYVTNHVNGNKSKVNIITRTNKDILIPTDTILLTMRKHGTDTENIHGEIVNIEEINTATKRRATDQFYYITVPASMGNNNFNLGDIISTHITSPDGTWTGFDTIIGCRQALVIDGEIPATVKKENSNGAQTTNIPRTAVGVLPNGHVVICSVESLRYGGRSKSSDDPYGLNLPQLADFMRYIGVRDGANMDGGGSTQLLVRETPESKFKVWVRSSDTGSTYVGQTRPVINSILVFIENEE